MRQGAVVLSVILAASGPAAAGASGTDAYEVWAIDQSNSPGRTFGGNSVTADFGDGFIRNAPLCWKCLQKAVRVRNRQETRPSEQRRGA